MSPETSSEPPPETPSERETERAERQAIRDGALRLLGRREHSALELQHKLTRRGHAAAAVSAVLAQLLDEGWIDDHRYAEVYAGARADKGYGPLRIRMELRERGVADEAIDGVLAELRELWTAKLRQLRRKRFGEGGPGSVGEKAKQLRFLRQRGFPLDQINQLFRQLS